MSVSPPAQSLPAITFYGLQSKKRSLAIKRSLETQTKRLRAEKIPDPYHSGILGPSAHWQIFHRQQEALDFVTNRGEDLHVFSFECQHPDKRSGQRQFLVATYPVFWHYYMQLDVSQRHHYEVIPEGSPCKLYFDLEFNKHTNPSADGAAMVETIIKYLCCWLQELYGVQCNRCSILELTASTETKFSRHLIFQGKGLVFKDNVTEGQFIRAIFDKLEDQLFYGSLTGEEVKHGSEEFCAEHTTVIKNATVSSEQKTLLSSNAQLAEDMRGNSLQSVRINSDQCCCIQNCAWVKSCENLIKLCEKCDTGGRSCENLVKQCETCVTQRHDTSQTSETSEYGSHGNENGSCRREIWTNDLRHRSHTNSVQLQEKCECSRSTDHEDVPAEILIEQAGSVFTANYEGTEVDQVVGSRNCVKGFGAGETLIEVNSDEDSSLHKKRAEGASEAYEGVVSKVKRLCHRVFQKFNLEDLKSLFVKNKEGRDTCFADLGVYTKNRNFRLYKSCKLGKKAAFVVATDNKYGVEATDERDRDKEIFLASLVTNITSSDCADYLTFGETPDESQPLFKRRTLGSARQSCRGQIEGLGKSPYPEIDEFITSQVYTKGGAIRRWTYFADAEVLTYDIMGYRFCYNVQRQHRSNNIKLVADLQKAVWYQKCYDPDCQAVNFKSQEFKLPTSILPAYYLADDFENLTENNVDEEDALCLLALQDVEEQMSPTTNTR